MKKHWLSASHTRNWPSSVFWMDAPRGVCTIRSAFCIGFIEMHPCHGLGCPRPGVAKPTFLGFHRFAHGRVSHSDPFASERHWHSWFMSPEQHDKSSALLPLKIEEASSLSEGESPLGVPGLVLNGMRSLSRRDAWRSRRHHRSQCRR